MRDVHRAKCGDQKNGNGHPAARCPANEGLDGVPCVRGGLVGPTGLLAAVKAGCRAISEKVGSQFLSLRHAARKVINSQCFVKIAVGQPISWPILPIT